MPRDQPLLAVSERSSSGTALQRSALNADRLRLPSRALTEKQYVDPRAKVRVEH